MPKRNNRIEWRGRGIVALIVVTWFSSIVAFGLVAGVIERGNSFSIVHWEVTQLTGFVLNRSPGIVSNRIATDAQIYQYFDLLRQSRSNHQNPGRQDAGADQAQRQKQYDALLRQAQALRLPVEGRYEMALEAAVRRIDLVERVPLFADITLVWPPVATGFSVPPHILIVSPRDRIEIRDTQLLRTDLSDAEALRIETQTESKGVSALVDQIGGLGAYPSIADQDDSPLGLMQTVAHEWMHEYLVFHPLGARYAASNDMTFINETVAQLAGRELGSLAFDLLGLTLPAPAAPAKAQPPQTPTPPRVDFNRTMHDLRLEVDQLLKEGRIDEAEQRMNATQRLLAGNGYNTRRINQAYFAFYGSYGDNAAASNPLAAKIDAVRRENPSLRSFIQKLQAVSQPSDIDGILQRPSR